MRFALYTTKIKSDCAFFSIPIGKLWMVVITIQLSCENKFYKEKYDINYSLTNKSDSTIRELKVGDSEMEKIWIFKNVGPGETNKLTFNIKRDLKKPEGSIVLTASFNMQDSVYLPVTYFTNWYNQGPNPASFNIYKDRIEEVK